jgi:hypothetical protein
MKNSISKNIARDLVAFYATKSQITLAASILGFGIVSVNPAQAASLVNGSGISNLGTTITFDEIPLANGIALTNQYSSLGVTFTGLFYNPFPNPFPNINPPSAGNFPDELLNSINPFVISFAQSQSAAAFSLATGFAGTSTFEALLNGTVVDSFSSATDFRIANNFYGFTGVTFDAIRVSAGGPTLIDNIQFTSATAQNVPEPFTIIGTLVGGTAAVRMRKKLKSVNKA